MHDYYMEIYLQANFVVTVPPATKIKQPTFHHVDYEPKPEIRHIFRQPEKRPHPLFSDIFTAVCLAPFLLLFVLWHRVGTNFTNMPDRVWTPLFHIGLISMFGLYIAYWLQLNMFDTLKYLFVVGSLTFITGNHVLKAVNDKAGK
ncbi:unnamed protein product [Strongylus vulgaris]|uniref:Ribophorin II C-terminal domain-containing protein n=1 Tax=Strongylus vulgaris TaxID=40348 RepID=A0A3P7J5B3_STRVU|nr:unnamed protein product [Strongylus vulgaris]